MKIDYYALREPTTEMLMSAPRVRRPEPDLEHELPKIDAVARAKCGDVVLLKVWLRTAGVADLETVERVIADAIAPLGLR